MCMHQRERVLLVDETGTGKTSVVQHLARQLEIPLILVNMSQQLMVLDLLGIPLFIHIRTDLLFDRGNKAVSR